ncbi:ABC-type spermidine/putrescine transport system, permease component I [Rhizobium leguminosarum bv. trifolii WSM597]|uniref:ABC-type spermidine/putrescine transport system, permease component I n=1 Tax=Rhizobium leguminosarum bv. trifolii WSM597 TaxID=754764 RepID=I9XDJ7_RHILT|nr:ABC transporter permease subunit [Rhizobium leguminosarum]EJB07156.1 ABC-type spermidine/putrescine transport system, permease component I [Rhizobium leguminosarum bv. trifolii WSM597]
MQYLRKLRSTPLGLAIPAFAILLVVFGIPVIKLFLASLNAPAFSLANYEMFFGQAANVRILLQTMQISAVVTAISVLIGYPTAYLMVAASKPVRITLIVLVVLPYLTSGLARTYAWVVILGDHGLINNLLLELGLITSPLDLIYNRGAVYIGMVHIILPTVILPMVSVMLGIDKSLMSAARSMGARPLAAFLRVFLPLSLPGVRSGSLLAFVFCLGFYVIPNALGGLRDAMLSNFIASQVSTSFNMPRIAAAAFVLLAITVALLSVFGLDLSSTQTGSEGRNGKAQRTGLRIFSALARLANELSAPLRRKHWVSQLHQAAGRGRQWEMIGTTFVILVLGFLLFPSILVIFMSFSAGSSLGFPTSGLSLQWYKSFFEDPSWTGALWISIKIGTIVAVVATIAGTLAAYGLSRTSSQQRSFLTTVILAPNILPGIVVAVAIYLGLLNLGLIGSLTGIVLAHSVVAMGIVVVIVSGTLANFDHRLEQAANSMRAGPFRTFTRVTLPLIRPGIIGGAVFAFLSSFDDIVITSLISGFSIKTLPLKLWEDIRHQLDPTMAAVSSLLMLVPIFWLVVLYAMWWRSKSKTRAALPEPVA